MENLSGADSLRFLRRFPAGLRLIAHSTNLLTNAPFTVISSISHPLPPASLDHSTNTPPSYKPLSKNLLWGSSE